MIRLTLRKVNSLHSSSGAQRQDWADLDLGVDCDGNSSESSVDLFYEQQLAQHMSRTKSSQF